jgi:hypothetical protein
MDSGSLLSFFPVALDGPYLDGSDDSTGNKARDDLFFPNRGTKLRDFFR